MWLEPLSRQCMHYCRWMSCTLPGQFSCRCFFFKIWSARAVFGCSSNARKTQKIDATHIVSFPATTCTYWWPKIGIRRCEPGTSYTSSCIWCVNVVCNYRKENLEIIIYAIRYLNVFSWCTFILHLVIFYHVFMPSASYSIWFIPISIFSDCIYWRHFPYIFCLTIIRFDGTSRYLITTQVDDMTMHNILLFLFLVHH